MESTVKQKQARANRIQEMASELVDKVNLQIRDEGILQSPEIVAVFAMACVLAIGWGHQMDPDLGSDLAGTAIRTIMKNLTVRGIKVPDLGMEGWVPPNIQSGNGSQH